MHPLLTEASQAAQSAQDQVKAGHPETAVSLLAQAVWVVCQYLDLQAATAPVVVDPDAFEPMSPE